MGLTVSSTGRGAAGTDERPEKGGGRLIALAGNPNVGKSTLFNKLTGLRQHTGNWPGKTVGSAYGRVTYGGDTFTLADIPGAYSLAARSAEEEVARDFLCFGGAQAVAVVCDASCLRRNLCLALQIMELTGNVVLCVNLMDEARKRNICPDTAKISRLLGVRTVGMSAAGGEGLDEFMGAIACAPDRTPIHIDYGPAIEEALQPLQSALEERSLPLPSRWLALRLLEGDGSTMRSLRENLGLCAEEEGISAALENSAAILRGHGVTPEETGDIIAEKIAQLAGEVCNETVCCCTEELYRGAKIDKLLTHRILAWPVMAIVLAGILWLTIAGANYPSELLSSALFRLGELLRGACGAMPETLRSMLFDGVYKTSAWVASVMLPPMAIFFPLFTLLEDMGFLPRVAFNLDGIFKKCSACGKQGLTMCMGLGCNAAGVVGCRIIDSPRERMIAVLTNSFMPCNGRFPAMIALISIFFASEGGSLESALVLTGVILLGVAMVFAASKLLSGTLLKGLPSSFVLELPPYRRPQIGRVIVRSVFDRTLFVLGRALAVAAPSGLVIWLLANVNVGAAPLLTSLSGLLEPAGRFLGLDGVVLLAFILGLPANEIVIPITLMCYMSRGSLTDYSSLSELGALLSQNGWTNVTAACFIAFSLMHWPCSTTLMTVKKETGSLRWTALAFLLPTVFGIAICSFIAAVFG